MKLRLHHFLEGSRANGPGMRAVIWVQGCSLHCPGCFNPETHRFGGGETVSINDLFQRIVALAGRVEGITISGGEPLQQRPAVTEFLRKIKTGTSLSAILFSGYGWQEIERMADPKPVGIAAFGCSTTGARGDGGHDDSNVRCPVPPRISVPAEPPIFGFSRPQFLNYLDVLIAGRYVQDERLAQGLRGSANKTIHLLTSRYTRADLESVPAAEVVVSRRGELILSGIAPLRW